ncbi:MAG: DUF1697 domain-containing protein [Flavobacteriaceae bacterium]|jgi:uncharacterized protein (DUF1697 family)|nr:DUF1697 domain-containing protein [Flavobacteriaceae bacterium]
MLYIALLRGINVGGHNKVPMAVLRVALSQVGLKNVQTYIQSGNIVFEFIEDRATSEKLIQSTIFKHFGIQIPVIVKTRAQMETIFDACPYELEKKTKSYFIIFNKTPIPDDLKAGQQLVLENEEVLITDKALYLYSSLGMGKSKFNMKTFERKLNVTGTSRNYNTMLKLLSLSLEK